MVGIGSNWNTLPPRGNEADSLGAELAAEHGDDSGRPSTRRAGCGTPPGNSLRPLFQGYQAFVLEGESALQLGYRPWWRMFSATGPVTL